MGDFSTQGDHRHEGLVAEEPLALFIIIFLFRMLTTLPVLKGLTALGLTFEVAKMVSQIPTVLFVGWLVAWFGWRQRVGLIPSRWWSRGLDLAMLSLPVLQFLGALGLDLNLAGVKVLPWLLGDALMVAIWEEIYFRGLMLTQLEDRYPRYAVIIAALAFGMAHASNGALGAAGGERTGRCRSSPFPGDHGGGRSGVRRLRILGHTQRPAGDDRAICPGLKRELSIV